MSSSTRPATAAGSTPSPAWHPTGVVTIPTATVSPVGSLVTGRSCGPIRNPRSARSGTALGPPTVSMIGSPNTMTATVDPVGATRSRR